MEHVFPKGAHHMHGAQWKGTFLVWKPGFLPFTQIPFPQATLFCMAWWGESIPRFRVENQTHPPKTNHQKRENAFTLQIQRPLLSLSLSLPPLRIRPPRGFGRASASLPSKPESSAKRRISARLRRRLPSRSRAAKIEDFRSSRRLRSERTGRRRRFGGVSGGEEKGRHTPRVSDVGELIQGEMCVRGLEDGKMKIKIMNKNTSNWIMIHTKIYIILYVRVCCIIHCNPGCTQLISNGGW